MTLSDSMPAYAQADHSPLRALLQMGLGLVCLILGGVVAVGMYGPSMLGSTLASSRFSTLNNRIKGVLVHEQSVLSWTEHGHIKGLRLVGSDDEDVLRGSLYVPPLLDWWNGGLLPEQAHVSLDLLRLTMDPMGNFNLLQNLIAKAGVAEESPFFNEDLLNGTVNYYGDIEKLVFEDQRSTAGPVSWSDVTFEVSWSPGGLGHLELHLGGDQLEVELNWEGMGETFSIASLKGDVKYNGSSKDLETLLGFPGGITGAMSDMVRVALNFRGGEGSDQDFIPTDIRIGDTVFPGQFDGSSFKMNAGSDDPSLGPRGFKVLDNLLAELSGALPDSLRDKVGLAIEHHNSWTWILKGLETGITRIDPSLPMLEGLLASSRLVLAYEMNRGLSLSPTKGVGDVLDLGESSLNWTYDPESGRGSGKLEAFSPLDPNLANLMLGISKKEHKGFELHWSGSSPWPSKDVQLGSAKLSHTLTEFYLSYLPAWGASLPGVLGASCSMNLRRLSAEEADDTKHGGRVPGWELGVSGAKHRVGEDFVGYVSEGSLWMDPDQTRSLLLQPERHGGIYEQFFGHFLPWFDTLKVNGGSKTGGGLLVDVSNLAFRGENLIWGLEEGLIELAQLDEVDYTIESGWNDIWGADNSQTLEPISFEVDRGKATYEELQFPVGMLEGVIDFTADRVDLSLMEVNPFLGLLPEELQNFARGVRVLGPIRDPGPTKPLEDS